MDLITSKDNEKIKEIKKLKEKKYREEKAQYLIEGLKMIEEAINEKVDIDTIVICEECVKIDILNSHDFYKMGKYNIIYVTKKIFDMLSDVKEPQGIMAVINQPTKNQELNYKEEFILVLDNIQDPRKYGYNFAFDR